MHPRMHRSAFRFVLAGSMVAHLALAVSGFGGLPVLNSADEYASALEKEIRSGVKQSYRQIVPYHPRLWAFGEKEWDPQQVGSMAWKVVHGTLTNLDSPANDQAKAEFFLIADVADAPYCFGIIANQSDQTFGVRFLWTILAGHARRYGWGKTLPSSLEPYASRIYNPQHSDDEFYADARAKVLGLKNISQFYEWAYYICVYGAVAYDWLLPLKYSNGDPVLSNQDKIALQNLLIENADHLRARATGQGQFFIDRDLAEYVYPLVGMALYEPSLENDPNYSQVNAKAKLYLDDFDGQWVGKILPALNAQGGDGGWHGGFAFMSEFLEPYYTYQTVIPWQIAPLLFAHYTSTGESIERSLFSTGIVKNNILFQNYMIRPSGVYYPPEPEYESRMPWIGPMRLYARRRFSDDPEQRKLAELGGWLRAVRSPSWFVNEGSWDSFDQLMFEDKWINPRSAQELGYPLTYWFRQLGWVFMRSGFSSTDDLAALFICQRYRWSALEQKSQNSLTLEYKGALLEGYNNTVLVNGEKQRTISEFPSISDGVQAFAPGSKWDIGPGLVKVVSGNGYDVMVGDATRAYQASKVSRAIRTLVHLQDSRIFILYDRIITKAAATPCSWLIDPVTQAEKINESLLRISNGKANLWIKRLAPATGTVVSSTADKYEWQASSTSTELQFLHVLQPCEGHLAAESLEVIADDAQYLVKGDQIGTWIGQWQVLFQDTSVVVYSIPTGSKTGEVQLPVDFILEQNFPNPFNSSTHIGFSLAQSQPVDLAIYDLNGRRLVTMMNQRMAAGRHEVSWSGKDETGKLVGTGIYFCCLRAGSQQASRKLVLLE